MWLRELLLDMPQDDRCAFLDFATAVPRLPPGLGIDVHILAPPPSSDGHFHRLPTAHTCSKSIHLPAYDSKEQLKTCLTEALRNAQHHLGGFHEHAAEPAGMEFQEHGEGTPAYDPSTAEMMMRGSSTEHSPWQQLDGNGNEIGSDNDGGSSDGSS